MFGLTINISDFPNSFNEFMAEKMFGAIVYRSQLIILQSKTFTQLVIKIEAS